MNNEKEEEFEKGPEPEKEDDVYDAESRDQQEEDAEITPAEEGFMKGYDDDNASTCATCGLVIVEKEGAVQKEIEGKEVMFCSQHCADKR